MPDDQDHSVTDPAWVPPGVDTTRPSPARMYDYMLGGTHNYEVDRAAVEKLKSGFRDPADVTDGVWANRGFHQRAARWMAGERGVRQFIDVGAGLPTQSNTHHSVRKEVPDARVVYVDNDPQALALGGELLGGVRGVALIDGDLRDPDAILAHPGLRELVDLGEPAGLLMTAVLHFVADGSGPHALVRRLVDALAPGSYLAVSHVTGDTLTPRAVQGGLDAYAEATEHVYPRTSAQVQRFFDGLELVPPYAGAEPVVTYVGLWGAEDPQAADTEGSRAFYCGVARKP